MKPEISTSKDFARDLAKGLAFEDKIALYLESQGYETRKPEHTQWDLEIISRLTSNPEWSKVEIKCDYKAMITGNIALETEYRGKPSGVMGSDVDYWVHGVGNTKAYMIPFFDLKESLIGKNYRFMPSLGDGSSGLLVPIRDFEKFENVKVLENL